MNKTTIAAILALNLTLLVGGPVIANPTTAGTSASSTPIAAASLTKTNAASAEDRILVSQDSVNVRIQESDNGTETNDKTTNFCIFWGLIGSCKFSSTATLEMISIDVEVDSIQTIDRSQYEHHSILWGAVKWSKKRVDAPSGEALNTNNAEHNPMQSDGYR